MYTPPLLEWAIGQALRTIRWVIEAKWERAGGELGTRHPTLLHSPSTPLARLPRPPGRSRARIQTFAANVSILAIVTGSL